jgi:hypothetical protein
VHVDFRGLDRIVLIVDRRGRARQVVNLVDLDKQRIGYIVSLEFEIRVAQKSYDVPLAARVEIVDAEYVMLILEKPFAEMRPQKSGPAGYRTSFSKMHDSRPPAISKINQSFRK